MTDLEIREAVLFPNVSNYLPV